MKKKHIEKISEKKGRIYIKSTIRNLFCTLIDPKDNKVITSCSLKVPKYINEFNEREDPYKRGELLGELFGERVVKHGYKNLSIYLDSKFNKARNGVLKGLGTNLLNIYLIQLSKGFPHNGCRPPKARRKKFRTKHRER